MGAGVKKTFEYYNVSCGVLEQSVKNPETSKWERIPYNFYTGTLRWIEIIDDNFGNKATKKVKLVMLDSDNATQQAIIQFLLKGWYGIGFFQRMGKVELNRPFTLGVNGSKESAKISFCWITQEGLNIEKDESFPLPTVIDAETKDWRATVAAMDAAVKGLQRLLVIKYGSPFVFSTRNAEDNATTAMPVHSPGVAQQHEAVGHDVPPPPADDDLPF